MTEHDQAVANNAKSNRKMDVRLLGVLITISLAFNVYLAWRLNQEKSSKGTIPSQINLTEGMVVPSIYAEDLADKPAKIQYDNSNQPTVIYAFSPTCVWCDRNLANIKALALARGSSYRFIGLSLTGNGVADYVASHKIDFPVYKNPSPETLKALGLGSTPQTIIVSSEGKVLKNWVGAYGKNIQHEAESYFDIHLPGLTGLVGENTFVPTRCAYCIGTGHLYSPGAIVMVNSLRFRCGEIGQWDKL